MKLEPKNLTKKYDLDTLGIEDVSFAAENGIFGVAGEAGSGKRTLLGAIGGVLDISSGELLFDGVRANELPPSERDALLIRGEGEPVGGSVEHDIVYGLRLRGMRAKEAGARAREAAELLGITDALGMRARSLPPALRFRVGLARLAARRARIALLSDPYAGMTEDEKREAYAALVRVREHIGDCVAVVATGDGSELKYCGDEAAILRGGHIVRRGRVRDILADPRSAYVARFTADGHVNILTDGEKVYMARAEDIRLTEGDRPVLRSAGGYTLLYGGEGLPPVTAAGETARTHAGFSANALTELPEETALAAENALYGKYVKI